MNGLFPDLIPKHDPGGKVRLPMQAGMQGSAEFSSCERYRYTLTRRWDGGDNWLPFVLWIGCNPSTATANEDDPTIRREIGFTARLGYRAYVKTNLMDYRATHPKTLLEDGVTPCSDINHGVILKLADEANVLVAAWGQIPKSLHHYAESIEDALHGAGHRLMCVGLTKHGFPRHPLYVAANTQLEEYRSGLR